MWRRTWTPPTLQRQWARRDVNPLVDGENGLLGVSIVFFDMTTTKALFDKLMQTNRQLESAYEELQSTNEELETTNEELQSTNEELETMNEELQSTNDELHTINDTLRERGVELNDAKAFLDALINSIHFGMVVVDREMRVLVWNRGCEELWGLRADETKGKVLGSLDIGLPTEQIKPLIGKAFVDADVTADAVVDAVNRRGRATRIRVSCAAFRSDEDAVNGALLLMEPQQR